MRIRAFPFNESVREFIDAHASVFVVEQNRDAQLRSLIAIETGVPRDNMMSVLDYGGMPLTAKAVVNAVTNHQAKVHA
ncbi:MAG: 2-oxoacid:acceptor oxidoreductase subunit alpha, partial [Gemmatimonas sp.]